MPQQENGQAATISIHALLAESDPDAMPLTTSPLPFLSTLSLRRATMLFTFLSRQNHHFYPRSPCGERLHCGWFLPERGHRFLSTLSLRRATEWDRLLPVRHYFYPRSPCGERLKEVEKLSRVTVISIHALLAESDRTNKFAFNLISPFLSTLSLRRATGPRFVGHRVRIAISIHALLAESDTIPGGRHISETNFYPRSPCGERHDSRR